jgi:hypothetical protein
VVEHSPHHSKVEGLSPATADASRREKIAKKCLNIVFLRRDADYFAGAIEMGVTFG